MKELNGLVMRYPALEECRESIAAAVALLEEAFRAGGKLLVCGNGGSASDALHIVGELMKGFVLPRALSEGEKAALRAAGDDGTLACHLQGALPAVAIGVETALQTAYANDAEPRLAFAQQVYGLGSVGDVLLAISTSGNSQNCIHAAVAARAKGMKVISLTGMGGGRLAPLSDVCIAVPEKETYKVQEYHLPIYHAMCLALERRFFGEVAE